MGCKVSSTSHDFKKLTNDDIVNYVKGLGSDFTAYSNIINDYKINGEILYSIKSQGSGDLEIDIHKCLDDLGIDDVDHKKLLCKHLRICFDIIIDFDHTNRDIDDKLSFDGRGVYLHVLDDFIESCGGESEISNLSIHEICEKYVKKDTRKTKSSYCEYLAQLCTQQNKKGCVGQANVFISHTWQYNFLNVVTAIKHHFRNINENNSINYNEVVIWFDLFSANHHIPVASKDFTWWLNTYKAGITRIGHTVLVITGDPLPLSRLWCLFEIHSSIETNSVFEVAMTESDHNGFIKDVAHNYEAMNRMIQSIDITSSEARYTHEKELLLTYIGTNTKTDERLINKQISNLLHKWVISLILTEIEALSSTDTDTDTDDDADEDNEAEVLSLIETLADIYRSDGRYSEAEVYYSQALEMRKSIVHYDFHKISKMTHLLVAMYIQEVC